MHRAPRIAASLVAVLALAGCTAPPAEDAITFAVAGDSLTAWDDQTFPEPDGELVDADVLVVMVGTNDTGVMDTDTVLASIDDIVATADARSVLISAIPPDDGFAADALTFNLALVEHAAEREWAFVDPWADMRVDGVWRDGLSIDGIHPTADAAKAAGEVISSAIRQLVEGNAVGGTG